RSSRDRRFIGGGGRRLPVAPAGRRCQTAASLQTGCLDHLDAARRRHACTGTVDLDPLALLWLVGTLHADLNVFRGLTIPWAAVRSVRSFGLQDRKPFAIIPLLWRATANHQSTTYTHEAGETSIDFSTVVGSLCISSVLQTPSIGLVSDFAA